MKTQTKFVKLLTILLILLSLSCELLDTKFAVTYNGNGSTTGSVPIDLSEYIKNTNATILGNDGGLEKVGYTFVGWSSIKNDDTVIYKANDTISVSKNLTLYASWEVLEVYNTTTFESNLGSLVESTEVLTDHKLTKPTEPTRDGYAFYNWFKDENLTNEWDFENDLVTVNMTLYAAWNKLYTVTFNTYSGTSINNVIVEDGTILSKPEDPTKDGFAVVNWYKDADLSILWDFNSDVISEDTDLYIKWIPLYTISFNTDGGSSINSLIVQEGDKLTKPVGPTKDGYVIENWYKDIDLTILWDFDNHTIDANTEIYIKWTPLYSVTFNTNGGSSLEIIVIEQGKYITEPINPLKEGFALDDWYQDSELTIIWDFDNDTVSSDKLLYAKWVPLYTVSFNTNEGSTVNSRIIAEGNTIYKPSDPTKSGFAVDQWFHDIDLTTVWDFSTDTISSDTEIYVKWIPIYTVTFDSNDGTSVESLYIPEGRTMIQPVDPTKQFCSLIDWYSDIGLNNSWDFDNNTITKDTILYAKWRDHTEMISVIGGDFKPTSCFQNTLSDFKIGKYEVTYELWYVVSSWAINNGYNFYYTDIGREGNDGTAGAVPTSAKDEPLAAINWVSAIVWCNAYSEWSNKTPVYVNSSGETLKDARYSNTEINLAIIDSSSNGYRLPTEGEWQFAASGGNSSNNYTYSGSDTLVDVAWTETNSSSKTHSVGTKLPNELGIYDMSGNVMEWCFDLAGDYPGYPDLVSEINYTGPSNINSQYYQTSNYFPNAYMRTLRGGDWNVGDSYAIITSRDSYPSYGYQNGRYGFRLASN